MSNKQLPDIHSAFPEWYNEIVYRAELVELAPVKGCIVIRPYGYAIWENIVKLLDSRIKATGHVNAAFPLFIPESFLAREAKHVEGFSPELAVVTHAGGKELEEKLVVRPTSETIIHCMFAKWMHSWRDLPLKINQWANVVRWEMRTRPFLRTTEFWWQEGHTAHETADEAHEEAVLMWHEYKNFYRNVLAIPALSGQKSAAEKFAGADATYTVEGIMPDGKALQLCTSHKISQSFAHAFDMSFTDREGKKAYPYLTSWGFTTRSIGALVMVHGDQKGLILPPAIAPFQVVIVPIFKSESDRTLVLEAVEKLKKSLNDVSIRVHVDLRDNETPGSKFYHWETKGVPLRIELGPRDIASHAAVLVERIHGAKNSIQLSHAAVEVSTALEKFHNALLERAEKRMNLHLKMGKKVDEFGPLLQAEGGVYKTGWCGAASCEALLKPYQATIRCIPEEPSHHVVCFGCNAASAADCYVAKSY